MSVKINPRFSHMLICEQGGLSVGLKCGNYSSIETNVLAQFGGQTRPHTTLSVQHASKVGR